MDKDELVKRLESLEKMKANHLQDVAELTYVIEGLKKQIETYI